MNHALAFGQIGLLPHEYYSLLPHEWHSMVEGYLRRHYIQSNDLRYSTYLTVSPYLKNTFYPKFCSDYWPMAMDENVMEKRSNEPNMIDSNTWEALKKQLTLPPEKTEYETILEKYKVQS